MARIFCQITHSKLGQPIESSYVRHLMKRLAVKAGLDKRIHAHGLRHTMASEMRSENIDIGIISKHLGHSLDAKHRVHSEFGLGQIRARQAFGTILKAGREWV